MLDRAGNVGERGAGRARFGGDDVQVTASTRRAGREQRAGEPGVLRRDRHALARPHDLHGSDRLCDALLFVAWNLGTSAGMLAGSAVPDPDAFGVDAAFPATLLALLLPSLRPSDARRVGLLAAAAALLATPWLPAGLPVLVALAGLVAARVPVSRGSQV